MIGHPTRLPGSGQVELQHFGKQREDDGEADQIQKNGQEKVMPQWGNAGRGASEVGVACAVAMQPTSPLLTTPFDNTFSSRDSTYHRHFGAGDARRSRLRAQVRHGDGARRQFWRQWPKVRGGKPLNCWK